MHIDQILPTLQVLERELHQPATQQDAERLRTLLHPHFREFGRSGADIHWMQF